ncbi:MAG: hypothetical protein KatS3mg129_2081 [Leptospiraceae bacterium]|nr:MAG: hypothetical protein KatS3mg129_2081 [Leptospiraceae bacterium]
MDRFTAEKIIHKIKSLDFIKEVEFTGGTPEMNPHFEYMLNELSKTNKKISVRTSLTILKQKPYDRFIKLYKDYNIHIIASLPGVFSDMVNKQRGNHVFEDSIEILSQLNNMGYGKHKDLNLTLVYNPTGDFLPPPQNQLEQEYKSFLKAHYNIDFSNLVSIVNMPIKRFKYDLIKNNKYNEYINLLKKHFNVQTIDHLMCKHIISIDYKGNMYDCDFNLALNLSIKNYENKKFWEIDFYNFNPEITFKEHCYGCMVNQGSGCYGEVLKPTTHKNDFILNNHQDKNNNKENKMELITSIQKYYGEELQNTMDLKTMACCTVDSYPKHVKEVLPYIADEIRNRYYGCGSPIPDALEGLTVLDIGCGTGRDVYILSKLVGENGFVYGIDMTKNQIEIAERYIDIQTERFGYKKPNVKFIHDFIENIDEYFEENSVDLIISNCVFNLIFDKEMVLEKIYKILKNGGEFYFSDNYSDRRIPESLKENTLLYNECLSGALYKKDFIRIARKIGFMDPRVVSENQIQINNPEIEELIGNINFYSITYRLWKIEGLEDACEDYGQIAIYKGGIKEVPHKFILDQTHIFEKGKPERVCGNTALMLSATRYKQYFEIIGDFSTHYGEFKECGTATITTNNTVISSCGC